MNLAGRTFTNYLDWSHEGRSAIWLYIVAVVLGYVLVVVGSAPAILILGDVLNDPTWGAAAFTYTFLLPLVLLLLVVRLLLGRPAYSVALPSWPPRWRDFSTGIAIQCVAMAVLYLTLVVPLGRLTYRGFSADLASGLPLLLVTVIGFAIQTGFEELYFRGLVVQATRRITTWLPAVLGVQALWFAQLHAGNIKAWGGGTLAMLPYLFSALAMAWAAWRTGALLMPMGLHFANNLVLAVLVNTEGDMTSTAAPFVAQAAEPGRAALFRLAQAAIIILLVEFVVRRRRAAGTPAHGTG